MSIYSENLNDIQYLIQKVKNSGIEVSKYIEKQIQANIINKINNLWYAKEAVTYFAMIKEECEALSNEIAVQTNNTISKIASAYDEWLESKTEEDSTGDYNTIHFNPDTSSKVTEEGVGYKTTTGGDSRTYSYISSTSTKITINVTNILPFSPDGSGTIGIDSNGMNNLKDDLQKIKKSVEDKISSYNRELKSIANQADSELNLYEPTSSFYTNIVQTNNKIFNNITSLSNPKSLYNKIIDTIEKYEGEITTKVASEIF